MSDDVGRRRTVGGLVTPSPLARRGIDTGIASPRHRVIASDGLRFNATTGQDGNGDTVFNDRPEGQTYNTFTLPAYVTLDLRFASMLDLGQRRKVELIVEGFNLANRLNPTNVNRTWGANAAANATFNTVTAAETARQFQLAARISF